MPFVEREHYSISSKCRLHPDNDLFRDQEEHKIHYDINEWQCGYCKKSFRAEKFLDQHMDIRHYNLLNVVRGSFYLPLYVVALVHCEILILHAILFQILQDTNCLSLMRSLACGKCHFVYESYKLLDMIIYSLDSVYYTCYYGFCYHYMGGHITISQWLQNSSKCLADLCGALHCDRVMKIKSTKAKCSPAAVARNRHLCEVVIKYYYC